jgi:hypothetical protein
MALSRVLVDWFAYQLLARAKASLGSTRQIFLKAILSRSRLRSLLSLCGEPDAVHEICVSRIGTQAIKRRFSPEPEDYFLRADLIGLFQPVERIKILADASIKHGMAMGIAWIRLPEGLLLLKIHTPIPLGTKSLVRATKT